MGPEYEATLERARQWVEHSDAVGQAADGFRDQARAEGFVVRVLPEPGERVLITRDRRPHRINVRVVDGHVTAVDGVY